jgi:hypothetical protein
VHYDLTRRFAGIPVHDNTGDLWVLFAESAIPTAIRDRPAELERLAQEWIIQHAVLVLPREYVRPDTRYIPIRMGHSPSEWAECPAGEEAVRMLLEPFPVSVPSALVAELYEACRL